MTVSQTELAPQLLRLFYIAGLLDKSEWADHNARRQKHKPILDVLTQQVSLGTFRDLLNAELSFKSRHWGQSGESGLHEGLTATGMINDEELKALLAAHRPPLQTLLDPLARQGYLSADSVQRALEKVGAREADDYDWLVSEGLITAQMVCQSLSHLEAAQMRLAANFLALYVLRHNHLLEEKEFSHLVGLLSPEQANELRQRIKSQPGLGSKQISEKLEEGFTLPEADLGAIEIDAKITSLFPQSMIRRQMMLPFNINAIAVGVATSDPINIPLTALIFWLTGRWPHPHFVPGGPLIEKINSLYRKPGNGSAAQAAAQAAVKAAAAPAPAPARKPPSAPKAPAPAPAAEERPAARPPRIETDIPADNVSAVQLVSSLIESAIELHTTDIHLEPTKQGLVVRFRIDGELHRIMTAPAALTQSVTSRVKVLASMDVTERRRPQDGHFELRMDRHHFDFRISTLPAMQGEKIAIRILDESQVLTGLDGLGLLGKQRQLVESMIAQPYGMILVTGPTGSGKTSTLYSALGLLNKENRNLVTIEDPVEYQLEGINQVQVDPHIGLTFSEGLRSILRQDPDIIMVGEIRDGDTAYIAIRAAMTGHLVLSTLHTNTALGAVDALVHLGAAAFMVAGSLTGILSQRLVRQLCKSCRKSQVCNALINRQLGLPEENRKRIYKPGGCEDCLSTGYQGRTGVFEVIRLNENLRSLIMARQLGELERNVREQGMISLAEAGAQKVLDGVTSVDEVTRKVMLDV